MRERFAFPNPVNEIAARIVAGAVVCLGLIALIGQLDWLVALLALGFILRVAGGPHTDPLAWFVVNVVVPRLSVKPRLIPGPPKRFAQAIGATLAGGATVALALGAPGLGWALVAVVTTFALLESAVGFCAGCTVFAVLMRIGVIPESVCEECANISLEHK